MQKLFTAQLGAAISLVLLVCLPAPAESHRATRLGNPATRFASPLYLPEDLRNLLRSEALRADVEFIARESGYKGDMEDLRSSAGTNQIARLEIPVGTRLPAMSSRENGKAILLRNVLWAGKEPITAFEFYFVSKGRRYRVVAPQACANFWVEDHGKELLPVLALSCDAPNEVLFRRPATVCLTLRNVGNEVESLAAVTLPIPAGAAFASATHGGRVAEERVVWEWRNLAAGASNRFCVVFNAAQPGALSYVATARGARSPEVQSRCETRVSGVPAVLLEVVDLNDPIEVGEEEVYEITVLNQGTAALTNLKLVCRLEEGQKFVSGTGATAVAAQDRTITLEKLPVLAPKEKATWRVAVKTVAPGDVRFATELVCDQFQNSIQETEATQQY